MLFHGFVKGNMFARWMMIQETIVAVSEWVWQVLHFVIMIECSPTKATVYWNWVHSGWNVPKGLSFSWSQPTCIFVIAIQPVLEATGFVPKGWSWANHGSNLARETGFHRMNRFQRRRCEGVERSPPRVHGSWFARLVDAGQLREAFHK